MKQVLSLAVVGPGRAGQARIRAVDRHRGATLAAVVERAPAIGARSLKSVLADPSIDAVVICTPNRLHASQAREALEAGKHVLVEYPVASSRDEARALFALAGERGRVLHVAHVELLSASQRAQRRRVRRLGAPRGGEVHFKASSEGWIGDAGQAGSPALRSVPRLHRLVNLFDEAEIDGAELSLDDGGYLLQIGMRFASGGRVVLVEERGTDCPRSLRWHVECERGLLGSPPDRPAGAVFAQDLEAFVSRIRDAGGAYVSEGRILHVLGLVRAIEQACG